MKRAALLILDIINRTHVTKNHLLNLKIVMKWKLQHLFFHIAMKIVKRIIKTWFLTWFYPTLIDWMEESLNVGLEAIRRKNVNEINC